MTEEPAKPHRTIRGSSSAAGARFAIVASRFNDFLVEPLVQGALDALRLNGADMQLVTLTWVPGAFEIPLVALRVAAAHKPAAVICLGAVVRGDTPHFEYVSSAAANGIAQASVQSGVPCIFGVLTTDNLEQAIARCSGDSNKGFEAALAAIEMVSVLKQL